MVSSMNISFLAHKKLSISRYLVSKIFLLNYFPRIVILTVKEKMVRTNIVWFKV